jgi:hypothetical protein
MKRKGLILLLVLLMVTMCLFGSGMERYKKNNNESISYEKWGAGKTLVSEPSGITILDDQIYVTDKLSGTIVVLDKNGRFLKKSTKSNLFLAKPTLIKTDGELLYVVDSEALKLKVISKDFELIKSVKLPYEEFFGDWDYVKIYLDADEIFWDLEIIEQSVYLANQGVIEEFSKIYELTENDTFQERIGGFCGYISDCHGELMAVNTFMFGYTKLEHKNYAAKGMKSDKNYLYKVKDDALKSEFRFVDKYTPLDFLFLDDFIYVFSGSTVGLDKFSKDGEFVETVLNLDVYDSSLNVQLATYDNIILIAYPEKKSIYKVVLGKEAYQRSGMSFIKDYPNTFLLKSGTEVIVLDLLSFNVGSDDCRNEIELNRDEIISFLQDLFIQKSVEELSTPSGVDFLKRQIRDEINLITGFAGEKEEAGVLEVFLHILSLTSVQY